MQAWAQCTVQALAVPQRVRGDEERFPLDLHKEVAMILAGMVLYGRQEVTL